MFWLMASLNENPHLDLTSLPTLSNLVPRVLSYPPSIGRVGENPGNEVALHLVLLSWGDGYTRTFITMILKAKMLGDSQSVYARTRLYWVFIRKDNVTVTCEHALSFLACPCAQYSNAQECARRRDRETDAKTAAACTTNETKQGSTPDPIYPDLMGGSFLRFFGCLNLCYFLFNVIGRVLRERLKWHE